MSQQKIKTPKGTIDYGPGETIVRNKILKQIEEIYQRHGAVNIDTPVFELKDVLSKKYGEDNKLIYDLVDHGDGGESCSLRYDLTVPFARYLATHSDGQTPLKRYHIAKVYRRDNPSMTKGRMREFYQCDYDIAGEYDAMVADAEVLRVMYEVITNLHIDFVIKLNHRKILDGILFTSGVPTNMLRGVCSSIDKLDKFSWSTVRKELIEERGLSETVADDVGEFVKIKGNPQLVLQELMGRGARTGNHNIQEGIEDLNTLFQFLEAFGCSEKIHLDMSLARGIDYYTGVIFEAVALPTKESDYEETSNITDMGSIAAGGRYDELFGTFGKNKSLKMPCVGISIGLERIYSIISKRLNKENVTVRHITTQVYVVSLGESLLIERMHLCRELWDANISADFMYKKKARLQTQFDHCGKQAHQIPIVVIIGPEELQQGIVKIKDMSIKEGPSKTGVVCKREDLISELRKRLEALDI